MDILAYDYLEQGLTDYNARMGCPYGNSIAPYATKNSTYPLTVVGEIRNVANANYNTCYEKVASVGYSVRIYAKTKGKVTKQTIAREIAKMVDNYFTNIGLTRASYNANESLADDSIYEIIMTFSGNLHENRRNFI